MQLSAPAQRVLGCLVEKALATPQQYPLTLNSLRTACNQATGRDPVVDYDDNDVELALSDLREPRLVRTEVVRGSRTPKYSHRLAEELGLHERDQAVLALLLLRGPQTEGELRTRSDRLYAFGSLDEVDETLRSLANRQLAERLERRPGEKAERWRHRWSPTPSDEAPSSSGRRDGPGGPSEVHDVPVEHDASVPVVTSPRTDEVAQLRERVEALEAEVAALRSRLDEAIGPA